METLGFLYLAAGPGIALAVYIYYADKWEPEPKSMVIKSFFLGGLAVFPTSYFEQLFQNFFGLQGGPGDLWWQRAFFAFIGVALAEELCKFLFLKGFIYDDREFNEPFDGIVYGGILGCGFATVENLMYVLPLGYEVGILRILTAVPGHAFDGIILGYFLGIAKFSPRPERHLLRGLVLVTLLHGTYDTISFSGAPWSIYPILGLVVFGIYLALKAKRYLIRHSEFIESSTKKFYILKKEKKTGPFLLREIRDMLADGKVELEDVSINQETGVKKSVRQILYAGIGTKYRGLVRAPPREWPVKYVILFYGLTFGFYLYFWFHKNYRNFNNYYKLKLNPELRVLGLFVLTIIPLFIYGTILGVFHRYSFDPPVEISFYLTLAGIEAGFLFFLLRMIRGFLKKTLEKPFAISVIVPVFFVLSGMRKLLPADVAYYWLIQCILVLLQGGVLAFVQKDLNVFWKLERKEWKD